ncbi:polymerase delta-interacting protein 3 [Schistosoma bovis]|uniref:Polymerase delta-interacting protein 3 n=1 Tax=Schistosoma bovis TaxID=6184 RepID=A0A430QBZ3_SCHBO|nr:polymerase delta-interacting protein 3 [Schistosoma bovis]
MNATFERRLRQVSVKRRLGKTNTSAVNGRNDLRNKLNLTVRTPDARTLLRNRTRQRNSTFRDARNVLRSRNVPHPRRNPRVPFFIPIRTRKPRPAPLRPGIPDLLSLPLPLPNPLDFLNNPTPTTGLFANLLPFNEVPVSASSSGPKISPIQGFRVEIRNLQPSVTLDDVFELFSSVGSLRLCTVTRPGQAEVIYNHSSDALEAIERYNGRELDGRPMRVSLTTPVSDLPSERDTSARMASRLGPNYGRKQTETQAKQVIRESLNKSGIPVEVDADVVRKALFNVSSSGSVQSRRPVDFSELFSSVGSLRLCTVTRPGQAEVIYNHSSDALEAIERYNGRELDGRPMRVSLTTPVSDLPSERDTSARMASRLGPNYGRKQTETQAKQVIRESLNKSGIPVEVDADVVRKALFNVSSSGSVQSRRPVDFSVSLR